MQENPCARLLAYVTGLVNQRLLLQNEYLIAENRILRSRLPARMRLTDQQCSTLAEIGKRLGRSGLSQVAFVAKARYDSGVVTGYRGIRHCGKPLWPVVATWFSIEAFARFAGGALLLPDWRQLDQAKSDMLPT